MISFVQLRETRSQSWITIKLDLHKVMNYRHTHNDECRRTLSSVRVIRGIWFRSRSSFNLRNFAPSPDLFIELGNTVPWVQCIVARQDFSAEVSSNWISRASAFDRWRPGVKCEGTVGSSQIEKLAHPHPLCLLANTVNHFSGVCTSDCH